MARITDQDKAFLATVVGRHKDALNEALSQPDLPLHELRAIVRDLDASETVLAKLTPKDATNAPAQSANPTA